MKFRFFKILIVFLFLSIISSCNVVKRVAENEHLLTNTTVHVNGKKNSSERINELINQRPNNKLLGFPLRLHIYNLARDNRDSLFEAWLDKNPNKRARLTKRLSKKQLDQLKNSAVGFNNWLRKTGEPPVILDSLRTERSKKTLEDYYAYNGWFDREVSYETTKNDNKRASVDYYITTGEPRIIDSIYGNISSRLVDSIYQFNRENSFIKKGEQYRGENLVSERDRLTETIRNSGVYHFSQDYINYDVITNDENKNLDIEIIIGNRLIRNEDSIATVPFKTYRIKEVNVITDHSFENRESPFTDSIVFNKMTFKSHGNMKFRPKSLEQGIFIKKGDLFSDLNRNRTYRYLNRFGTFRYPNIEYIENEADSTLTALIELSPRKKYSLGFDVNVSQSNIQSIGFSFNTSLLIRNIFRGAETLEISALGAIGASKDGSTNDQFFDINELGADVKLTIPRIFFPIDTEGIIPKRMMPTTRMSLGFTSQTNIGLDKQTVNGIFNYNWTPNERTTNNFDLFNTQYVRNLNPGNYFDVYQNSFQTLENIALNSYNTPPEYLDAQGGLDKQQADDFINLVLQDQVYKDSNPSDYQTVNNIEERKIRLTEDNLIFASTFSFTKDRRESLVDEDFSIFRFKLESAGNLLTTASKLLGEQKNEDGQFELFGVPYSQYIKTELDYIKHWDIGRNNVIAIRSFFGIAIPYGNSNNIPFSKSFFAGGANDNRAWTAYDLGPGSSDSRDEFNEANMKIGLSLEHRFNLFGSLNGALFVDAGNIWHVADNEDDPSATFTGFDSLKDIAVGSGFGLRYDFGFFVLRGDIGFKTYDPSYKDANRWFNDYNFGNAVYNLGINYPF